MYSSPIAYGPGVQSLGQGEPASFKKYEEVGEMKKFDLIVTFWDGTEAVLHINPDGDSQNWECHTTPDGHTFGPNAIEENGHTISGWARGVMEDAAWNGGIKKIEILE